MFQVSDPFFLGLVKMRSQSRKQPAHENHSSKNEIANAQQGEDSEAAVKLPQKKNPVFSDGLPMNVSVEQLKAILIQPAQNVGDRAVLLDARDRLVRLIKDAKDKNISTKRVTTLSGTCLDMCPEKERYSRAEKHRLALYEMLVSPEKMVLCCVLHQNCVIICIHVESLLTGV